MKMSHTTRKTMMNESKKIVSAPILGVDLAKQEADLIASIEKDTFGVFVPKINSSSILMYTTGPDNPFEYPRYHWFDAEGPA